MNIVNEFKYLGVSVITGKSFQRCIKPITVKFFRSFYAVYSKVKGVGSDLILINLLKSKCLPILQYACDVFPPCKSDLRHLDRIIFRVLAKIFHTYDSQIISCIKEVFCIPDFSSYSMHMCHRFLHKFAQKLFTFKDVFILFNKHLL